MLGKSTQNTSALILELAPGSDILRARFDPSNGATPPNVAMLRLALQQQGYSEFFQNEAAIDQFILQCATASEPVVAEIGERRSAHFSLEISEDLMSAWLTLTPAQGGNPIGIQVHDELRDQGITHGILHSELNAALAQGWCDHLLIAKGEPVVSGTPGRFDVLFRAQSNSAPGVDENAKIKFRDLSHLLLVHANDPLMRITPPIQGKSGKDLKGQVVLAKAIPELKFGIDLQGAAPDRQDPCLLVAIQAGQPVEVADGVIVNPVITVPDVDLKTGKIKFEGTIHVEGDIKAGMSVEVTGDVIVSGMVESADIKAGGNVAVKGGVIGKAEKKAGKQQLADSAARIQCTGTVQALFMENVHVEAGNAIIIDQNARDCELIARNEIIVGKSGSRGGQISGGRAQASVLIQTDTLGSSVASRTRVQVGIDPYLEEQIHQKQATIQRKVADLDQVLKLIVYFERNPHKNVDGVASKVEAKRVQQLAEIDQLTEELKVFEEQLELVDQACVKVGKAIHDGVEMHIAKQVWNVKEDSRGGIFKLVDGHIVLV
ncbi:uncharacterized protein (DUF342 family) [Oxalobacteraceae bacterium GrIS 1.18]